MSYALLWIEALAISLLWVAMWVACAAHLSKRWVSRVTAAMIALIPFCVLGVFAALTTWLKFGYLLEPNWFGYTVSLLIAYSVCGILLLIRATRGTAATNAWAARQWPRGRLAAALLTAIAIGAMTLWNMDLEARSQAGMVQLQAGALMLEVSPPNVSDSRNAALIYQKAFARLEADEDARDSDPILGQESPDIKSPEVVALLDRQAQTLKLLHQAAALPDCRFDHDYARPSISMLLPELNSCRVAANLLRLHARSELSQGNVEAALADVNGMFHLSRAAGTEPILVSCLVSIGVQTNAIRALESVLPTVSKQEQLKGLDIGDSADDARRMVRSFQGEEAFGLSIFGDLGSGRMSIAQLQMLTQPLAGTSGSAFVVPESSGILLRVFFLADDVDAYRNLLNGYQELGEHSYFQVKDKARDLEQRHLRNPRRGLLTSIIAPAFSRVLQSGARSQALHCDAEVALAATRYRLDHGTLPTTLSQLVPDDLDEIPFDPFDGQPLHLARKDGEWTVYSIGPDAKDDSGVHYDSKTEKGDLPFTLKSNAGY